MKMGGEGASRQGRPIRCPATTTIAPLQLTDLPPTTNDSFHTPMNATTMSSLIKRLALSAILLMLPLLAIAQPALPAFSDSNQAPLAGLGVLALAGGAYALRRLRNRDEERFD